MRAKGHFEVVVQVEEVGGDEDGGVAEEQPDVGVCWGWSEAEGFGEGVARVGREVGGGEVDGEVVIEGVFEVWKVVSGWRMENGSRRGDWVKVPEME